MIEINWNPTHRQLRQFGLICLVGLPFFGWMANANSSVIGALSAIGCLTAVLALAIPQSLKHIFITISLVTAPIGMVMAEVAMLMIFYLVLFPIGLLLRLSCNDPLKRTFDREAKTYWESKRPPKDASSYYRQS